MRYGDTRELRFEDSNLYVLSASTDKSCKYLCKVRFSLVAVAARRLAPASYIGIERNFGAVDAVQLMRIGRELRLRQPGRLLVRGP